MPNTQDTQTKPQSAFQRFKAPIRKTLLYQAIFHPIRSCKRLREYIEVLGMSDDEKYFYLRHKDIFGYKADFKNPQTFNEKIIHRILYDRNPIYTYLADKLKARIYIANKLQGFTQDNIDIRERENSVTLNLAESKDSLRDSKQNNNQNTSNQLLDSNTLGDSNSSNSIDSNLLKILQQPIDSLSSQLFDTNACEFLPKLYGIWKSVDDIDFDKLPNSFVLKTNHDCGGVVLVPNKQDFLADKQLFSDSMQKLRKHLATNYYELFKEYHYKDIEPRVFAEELLGANPIAKNQSIENDDFHAMDSTYHSPNNYRIFAFPSQKLFIQVDDAEYDISHKRWFYDENWVFQPFSYNMPVLNDAIAKPQNLEAIKNMAKILAYNFARVDLYEINSRIFKLAGI